MGNACRRHLQDAWEVFLPGITVNRGGSRWSSSLVRSAEMPFPLHTHCLKCLRQHAPLQKGRVKATGLLGCQAEMATCLAGFSSGRLPQNKDDFHAACFLHACFHAFCFPSFVTHTMHAFSSLWQCFSSPLSGSLGSGEVWVREKLFLGHASTALPHTGTGRQNRDREGGLGMLNGLGLIEVSSDEGYREWIRLAGGEVRAATPGCRH